MSGHPEHDIEAILRDRIGRECLFVPSGRMALYLAFRTWLTPGDRLLMSPVTDDVIFFVALAAGLRPVMAPLARRDGNIQPEAVDLVRFERLRKEGRAALAGGSAAEAADSLRDALALWRGPALAEFDER